MRERLRTLRTRRIKIGIRGRFIRQLAGNRSEPFGLQLIRPGPVTYVYPVPESAFYTWQYPFF